MEFEPDLSKLEDGVSRLLEEYNNVKKKCEQLTVDLAEVEAQVAELKEEKMLLMSEKDTVHSRVSSILEKLSDWEGAPTGSDEQDSAAETKETAGQLFSMGS